MFVLVLLVLAAVCEFWAAVIDPVGHLGHLELLLQPLGLFLLVVAVLAGGAPAWPTFRRKPAGA